MLPNLCFKAKFPTSRSVKYVISLLLAGWIPVVAFAQEPLTFRKVCNKVHFNISIGSGFTSYHNEVVGMCMMQQGGKHYLYHPHDKTIVYLVRWFGDSYMLLKDYEHILRSLNMADADMKPIVFKGTGVSFPITLSGHIDIFKTFRVELGGSLIVNRIRTLKLNQKAKDLGNYSDPIGRHYVMKAFVMPGFKLFENSAYTLLFTTPIGFDFTYSQLSDSLAVRRSGFPTLGLGVTLERHISEYFSLFGRLSYNLSNFDDAFSPYSAVKLDQEGILIQFGVSMNYPEIPQCSVPHCGVEVKHRHSGRAYRGVPMWRGRDSRGHRLYEK